MKRFFVLALIMCSLSLSAFAAKNSQSIYVSKAVKVGATQVPAGSYKVSWTGTDANVQVSFTQNGKTILTTPAKLVPSTNKFVSLSTRTVNGSDVLEVIQLDKMNLELKSPAASGE